VRLLFVTHNFPRVVGDAAGSFVLALATAVRAIGHDVRVIAPHAEGLADQEELNGIRVTRVRYAAPEQETLAYTGTMAESVKASWGARFALLGMIRAFGDATRAWTRGDGERDWRPDLIHAHWWFPSALGVVTPRAPVVPLVITMHGSDVRLAHTLPGGRVLAKRVLRQASVRTAVSSWLASRADAFGGGRVEVAPMPIDLSRFRSDHTVERAPRRILFVGRLNAQKGVAPLLDAVALLPSDVTLTICADGPDRDALHARAASLDLATRVTWIPPVAQHALAGLYSSAAVVAMPSIGEGLGLVGVEAQACGTPVVGFASGGLTDVVQHERTGLLVPEGNVPALAEALRTVLDNPVRRTAMGAAGVIHASSTFSPSAVGSRYDDIYQRALRR
jgi:glycosyltransferase involved in cell wall biosynthesis